MNNNIVKIGACVAALFVTGCATTDTKYVSSKDSLVTTTGVNVQDWDKAADDAVQQLLEKFINSGSPLASSRPDGKALFAVAEMRNNTGLQLDTDRLTKRIRIALNNTGKVVTDVTAGVGGAEDSLANEAKRRAAFEGGQRLATPDYSLSGKIMEDRERAGSVRQVTYTFQLSLTGKDGAALWEGETTIIKQGKRANVGW